VVLQEKTLQGMVKAALLIMGVTALSLNGGAIAAPLFQAAPDSTSAEPNESGDVIINTEEGQTGAPAPESSADPNVTTTASSNRFSCQAMNGEYMVMYNPESQPGKFYPWAKPMAMGGGWSAERRCMEISRRLEAYRPDGLLEMKTNIENGYNVVCVTTQKISDCRIVLTVPQGQSAMQTRDRVFDNLSVADRGVETSAVNTFVGGNDALGQVGQLLNGLPSIGSRRDRSLDSGINLRPYLDRADGGTGKYLRGNGNSTAPGLRLNPDQFR